MVAHRSSTADPSMSATGSKSASAETALALWHAATAAAKPPDGVTVRPMKPSDIGAIAAIMQESFNNQAYTTERMTRMIEDCGLNGFVAVHDEKPVALVLYVHWDRALYVAEMATQDGWRGRGVGSALMRTMVELCRLEGWDGMWLHTWRHNLDGQKFYLAHGFEIFGLEPNAYGPREGDDAYVMVWGERFWQDVRARFETYLELWRCQA